MKKCLTPVLLLLALVCIAGSVFAQTPEPTQTPYIIYVVVTATPAPEEEMIQQVTESPAEDVISITRPTAVEPIALINDGTGTVSGSEEITITNPNSNSYAKTTDELVERVVATVMASANTMAGGNGAAQDYSSTGGAVVHLNDGSACTMNFG